MRAGSVFRVGAIAVGLILLLIAAVVVALHTPPARRYALQTIQTILAGHGIHLEADRLDYNLLSLTAWVEGVVVHSDATPELPPIARVRAARASLNWLSLLRGAIVIQDVLIERPEIHLVITELGDNNIPKFRKEGIGGAEPGVRFEDLRIDGGSLIFEDRRQQLVATLPFWNIRAEHPAIAGQQLDFVLERPGEAALEGRTLPIRAVSADLLLRGEDLAIQRFEMILAGSRLTASGFINDLASPELDVQLTGDLELASLLGFAGVTDPVAGRANMQIAARGPVSEARVLGEITGRNLSLQDLRQVDLNAGVDFSVETMRIRLDPLRITSPALGRVEGQANVALTPDAGISSLTAQIRGLDLQQAGELLDAPASPAGRVNGRLTARFPGLVVGAADADARLQIAPVPAAPQRLPVGGEVRVQLRKSRLTAAFDTIQLLGTVFHGQVTLSPAGRLSGRVTADTELGSLLNGVEAYLGRKVLDVKVAGPARVIADLGGTSSRPVVAVALSAPTTTLGALDNIVVTADAAYVADNVVVRSASARWMDQILTTQGTIDLRGRSTALDFTAGAQNVNVATILAAASRQDIPATGIFSLQARVEGPLAQPQASVAISGTGLSAYNEPLGKLTAEAAVRNDLIELRRFRLDKTPSGFLEATGSFDPRANAFSVDATGRGLTIEQFTLPDGVTVRGEVNLSTQGSGTLQQPTLAAEINISNLQVNGEQVGAVNAMARAVGPQVLVDINAPGYNLGTTAFLGTTAPYSIEFTATASGTQIESLPLRLDPPVTGQITATVQGTGTLTDLPASQAVARITQLNLNWRDRNIVAEEPIIVAYANRTIEVEQAAVRAENSFLWASGHLPVDRTAPPGLLEVHGAFVVQELLTLIPDLEKATSTGTLIIDALVRGSLEAPDPAATVLLQNAAIDIPVFRSPLTELNLVMNVDRGAAVLDQLTATWAQGRIQVRGSLPLGLFRDQLPFYVQPSTRPAELAASVNGIELAQIAGVPERVGGTVSLNLNVQAPKPALEAVTGRVEFGQLELRLAGVTLNQRNTPAIAIRNGQAAVEQFMLAGPGSQIQISGTAGLADAQPLDLRIAAVTDAAILALFTNALRIRGETEAQVAIGGTINAPLATGFIEMRKVQANIPNPRVQMDDLNARFELRGDRLNIVKLNGLVNGGALSASGGFEFAGAELRDVNIATTADDVYLEFPRGLRTISNAELQLQSRGAELLLWGRVDILEGSYTENLMPDDLIMDITSGRELELRKERNPFLEKVRFGIVVNTTDPIMVDNNLARLAATAALRLGGSWYRPGVTGSIQMDEGGELILNERRYIVERGTITLVNEQQIEPAVDILATSRVADYDITILIQGEAGKTETTLTSEPPLPEPDIVALLLTGRTLSELRGEETAFAREQVLSLVAGQLGQSLALQAQRVLGISQVRIEPTLIAGETDPGARLTVGQDLSRDLRLIYSMNLANSADQIWVAEYDISRRFVTRAVRQEDNSYRFEFRHDLRFGGAGPVRESTAQRRVKRSVGQVTFTGDPGVDERELAGRFQVEPGDPYDFFRIRDGITRLENFYVRRGFLEARIRMAREVRDKIVDLNLEIDSGPRVGFVFEGWGVSRGVRRAVRRAWRGGVFDAQRGENASGAIRAALVEDGYLAAKINHTITEPEPGIKRIFFEIQPGVRFRNVPLTFPGARGINADELEDAIKRGRLEREIHSEPERVAEFLTGYYRERGYLDATVEYPRYELFPDLHTGRILIAIDEGPRYRVRQIRFKGNRAIPERELRRGMPLAVGDTFVPEMLERTIDQLMDRYLTQGYTDIAIESTLEADREAGAVDVLYVITENEQRVVQEVQVAGTSQTSPEFVRSLFLLDPGEVLDSDRLARSRRNLYRTGAFTLIDIEREQLPQNGNLQPYQVPVRINLNVQEVQPFAFLYGAFFDTDRGPGVISDLSNRNSLGSARVLGLRTRFDSDIQEGRLYFTQPVIRGLQLRTDAQAFASRHVREAFTTDRFGISLQQESRFREYYLLTYGYLLERTHTFEQEPDPLTPFDTSVTTRIAPVRATLTRETRNDFFDPWEGSFTSHAMEWGASVFGSQLSYLKYFGQYFKYQPLGMRSEVPFSRGLVRPRLIYAGGVRVGLAGGLSGQEIVPSQRFFAGGGTSIRGFAQDGVGPTDATGAPVGGNAMLVINNEIRFPLISIFDGVGFLDVGNVYPRIADMDPFDMRSSAGVGLRLRTPFILLRLDWGFKLDRRPGESLGRLFFSIGQAF